jgi:hypothetical protein
MTRNEQLVFPDELTPGLITKTCVKKIANMADKDKNDSVCPCQEFHGSLRMGSSTEDCPTCGPALRKDPGGDDDGPTGWRRIIRRSVGSLNPRVGSFDPPQRLVGVHPGRLLQPTRTSSTGSPTLVALGKHLLISPL